MKRDISTLKSFFETGDKPTQDQFGDLIDSFVHKDATVILTGVTPILGGHRLTFSDATTLDVAKTQPGGVGVAVFLGKGQNNGIQNEDLLNAEPGDHFRIQPSESMLWPIAVYMGDVDGGGLENMANFTALQFIPIETFVNF